MIFLFACDSGPKPVDDTGTAGIDCSDFGIEAPGGRGEGGGVWDEARGRFLVFGGDQGVPVDCASQTEYTGELWAFYPDCEAWELIEADGPSPRGRFVTASDGERMIVYGGRFREGTSGSYTNLDDAWAFDFATDTWTELAESGPGGRSMAAGAVIGGRLLVHGGNLSESGTSYDSQKDLWALDLETGEWEEVRNGGGPGLRIFHAAVADDETLYVYGGGDDNAFTGPFFGDLWAYDVASDEWTELHDGESDAPDHRIGPSLVLHEGDLYLWAGHDDQELGNRNDLWRFDGGWEQLEEGDLPDQPANDFCDFPVDFVSADLDAPERRYHTYAAATSTGFLTFGGKSDCGILNDVWEWNGGWVERFSATTGEICPRAYEECQGMCF